MIWCKPDPPFLRHKALPFTSSEPIVCDCIRARLAESERKLANLAEIASVALLASPNNILAARCRLVIAIAEAVGGK